MVPALEAASKLAANSVPVERRIVDAARSEAVPDQMDFHSRLSQWRGEFVHCLLSRVIHDDIGRQHKLLQLTSRGAGHSIERSGCPRLDPRDAVHGKQRHIKFAKALQQGWRSFKWNVLGKSARRAQIRN